MNNSTRNAVLIGVAILVGLVLGFQFPMLGLLLIIPVIAFVVIIFLRNKGGADADESLAAEARQFTASEGKAAIYVMRKGFVAGQQGMNVTIDGDQTTQFRTGRFAKAEVEPGEHTITSQMASQTKGTAATHTVKLAAGECVLLDVKLSVGALQGSLSYEKTRNAAEARGKLSGLKLVLWSEPEA